MPERQAGPRVAVAFWLRVAIIVLADSVVGLERTVVPLLGRDASGLDA